MVLPFHPSVQENPSRIVTSENPQRKRSFLPGRILFGPVKKEIEYKDLWSHHLSLTINVGKGARRGDLGDRKF